MDAIAREMFSGAVSLDGWKNVLRLTKRLDGIELLRWNKELPAASAQDPLGLNLRLSARLTAELLYCITSITPRARYYSFFPWAFQDYFDHERGQRGDRSRVNGVLARERALVVGAVLHHDGAACKGGALGGSLAVENGKKSYDLATWRHLKAGEGQFGAAYKASLINLGIFKTEIQAVDEEAAEESGELDLTTQSVEVGELSVLGLRLAKAFDKSVHATRYVKEGWTRRAVVPADILKEFGSRAGLCEISGRHAADRPVLREIFFAHDQESTQSGHYRRRMSLLLLLYSLAEIAAAGTHFNWEAFSDLTYFERIMHGDQSRSIAVKVPEQLQDISQRWRIFHFHGYLTLALQSFLVGIVRVLRDRPGGIGRSRLLDELSESAISARFGQLFKRKLPQAFFQLTPKETLSVAGVNVDQALTDGWPAGALPIESTFSERALARLLLEEEEANEAAGIALAAMLLYALLLRYQLTVDSTYDAWYKNHVQTPFADISVPGMLAALRSDRANEWWNSSNREILDRVLWRFVLLQHQTMSYERGFGGNAPLFHIDGTTAIGTATDYIDPSPLSARLPSALQIVTDLGLAIYDDEGESILSSEGRVWLTQLLAAEAAR
jgi:hypothetical protein